VHWRVTWDGTRLVVVQRAPRLAWLAVVALVGTAFGWCVLAVARDAAAGWGTAAGVVSLLALAVGWVVFIAQARRRVEASDRFVRARRWAVPATDVRVLTVRRGTRRVSTRWGRGDLPVATLFVGLVGGRTVDLVTVDGSVLDGPAGRALAAALAALPYGRPPR
jgi:hypothetical protein